LLGFVGADPPFLLRLFSWVVERFI
jgi:hypothetical protein